MLSPARHRRTAGRTLRPVVGQRSSSSCRATILPVRNGTSAANPDDSCLGRVALDERNGKAVSMKKHLQLLHLSNNFYSE